MVRRTSAETPEAKQKYFEREFRSVGLMLIPILNFGEFNFELLQVIADKEI